MQRWTLALVLGACCASMAVGAELEKVRFHDQIQAAGKTLVLNNVGLMRYKVAIKAMVAGLYLEAGVKPEDALADVAKRLEIEYFWAIKSQDIVTAADKLLADNVAPQDLAAVKKEIAQLHALYKDVKPGDRYALTYVPGRGTLLSLNDKPLGVIPGAAFASAYFSIWLGERPMDVALKRQLLTR